MEALRLITNKNNVDSLQDLLDSEISDFWEPLFNNLGHTLRKLGKYSQAISVHRFFYFFKLVVGDRVLFVCNGSLKFPIYAAIGKN